MGERPKADQANLNRYCVVVRIFAKQCAAFAPRGDITSVPSYARWVVCVWGVGGDPSGSMRF